MKGKHLRKTCLTNHKGSISHHIMPLVINSLRGGHTHTHTRTYSHHGQSVIQSFLNSANFVCKLASLPAITPSSTSAMALVFHTTR